MFENEVIITTQDKETLLANIKNINNILNKYPYSSNYDLNTVTSISRAKSLSKEAEIWIDLLHTNKD